MLIIWNVSVISRINKDTKYIIWIQEVKLIDIFNESWSNSIYKNNRFLNLCFSLFTPENCSFSISFPKCLIIVIVFCWWIIQEDRTGVKNPNWNWCYIHVRGLNSFCCRIEKKELFFFILNQSVGIECVRRISKFGVLGQITLQFS